VWTREKAWVYLSTKPCLSCIMMLMTVFYVCLVIGHPQTRSTDVEHREGMGLLEYQVMNSLLDVTLVSDLRTFSNTPSAAAAGFARSSQLST
jgi:hypothetical protein